MDIKESFFHPLEYANNKMNVGIKLAHRGYSYEGSKNGGVGTVDHPSKFQTSAEEPE